MMDRKYDLGHENVGRLLLKNASPAVFALMVQASNNLVDTIFVGRGAGSLALAALAISFPIQMIILATAQVVAVGSASLISRSLGAGDLRKAGRTAGTALVTVGFLGVGIMVGGWTLLHPLLRLFGATDDVLPYAAQYLGIVLAGSFFFTFSVTSNNIVRAEGSFKVAMTSMLISALTNIVLDPIFIFGLHLGIRGAAFATVTAQFCSFVFLCQHFVRGKSSLRIRRQDLWPDTSLLPEVLSVGASSFTRVVAGSLMAIVLNNSIAFYGTDLHMAILGIVNRLLQVMLMPLFGLVQGLQPIVGFNFGAGNMKRVRQSVRVTIVSATTFATVGFSILMLFPGWVLGFFTTDADLIAQGTSIMRVMVLGLPLIGFQVVSATFFQSTGKAVPAMILSTLRQILLQVPLILLLPLFIGLRGIWVAFPIADATAFLVTAVWMGYELRRLTRCPEGMLSPLPGGTATHTRKACTDEPFAT